MADRKFRPEIEVLSAEDALLRRPWRDEEKVRIVEESFVGHRQASATARRYGISRSLLTVWRRQYRTGELGAQRRPSFIPLALSEAPETAAPRGPFPSSPDARVEIALRNGRRILVPADVDPEALARLLPVVERA